MRILLLVHAFNSLSQRMFVELQDAGHEVSVEFDIHGSVLKEAVTQFQPDLVLASFLKRAISEDVWKMVPCLIVHPGVEGDRGPSAVDWAILDDQKNWGVTVLQAEADMDAGPIWASASFPMRAGATKSSLYRNEVTDAASKAVHLALNRFASQSFTPKRLTGDGGGTQIKCRPLARQSDRKIDWLQDDTQTILRKIRSGDGVPGVKDRLFDQEVSLFDAHIAPGRSGTPGAVVARSGPAICRATVDGAIWLGHVRRHKTHEGETPAIKLPATLALKKHLDDVPEVPVDSPEGYQEISYDEVGQVGVLHFNFYNGAMSTDQCRRLQDAYRKAVRQPTNVVVLAGGSDFWSNGMHLNVIEAAPNPADDSWQNINAIDDLAHDIITTTSHLTISALQGNAGAGGVFLARAADHVWLRRGIVLNPHYKDMGNLYGSEYWTYLLPRYAGQERAKRISNARLPMSTSEAVSLGLGDAHFGESHASFLNEVQSRAQHLSQSPDFTDRLNSKVLQRQKDEVEKPLATYRAEELAKMKRNFYGFDPSYHIARHNFVHKIPKSRTPVTIARHRDQKQYSPLIRRAS